MESVGIDVGKITVKAVLLEKENGKTKIKRTFWKPHRQEFEKVLEELREKWHLSENIPVVCTGKFRQHFPFFPVVERVAQEKAIRFFYPNEDITAVRIGGGGFSVLKVSPSEPTEYRKNHECASGVGNFLDQILERIGLDVISADRNLDDSVKGIKITSRCGVTLKSEFTHWLNVGQPQQEVVAGLFDATALNALNLALKTRISQRVIIIGGLSSVKRIVQTIRESLPDDIKVEVPEYALFFEAIGAGLLAQELQSNPKKIFFRVQKKEKLEDLTFFPSLKESLQNVKKFEEERKEYNPSQGFLVLGLDIGSTGSKLVLFGDSLVFDSYTETKGNPVGAVKELMSGIPQDLRGRIGAVGCTGSGREIVAGLLKSSLPESQRDRVFVLNEIAAHAQGALYYDKDVDTIVDIGGQDAKFTRLEHGRIIDSCMNTVCSAGTGSFLAEQLQLLGISDVKKFGEIALNSPRAVDLGQHCAVFISERIDEARRKGATLEEIIAGLYYSIARNYTNRVKGLREYGNKIFLQGKPAENLALACALSKVSGKEIIVPPSPGLMGALGIAILAKKEIGSRVNETPALDFERFFSAKVVAKREFTCKSKEGCIIGNLCPIQQIEVEIGKERVVYFWGGACDKWEKTKSKNTLLAKAPRPFLEREKLIREIVKDQVAFPKDATVGIPRGLETEEILPLAVTFFHSLGFRTKILETTGLDVLERGARLSHTTLCAPFQLMGGQAEVLDKECQYLFLPKVIEIAETEKNLCPARTYVCPLSQAVPDMLCSRIESKILRPQFDFKKGYFQKSVREEFLKMGKILGCKKEQVKDAFEKAVFSQIEFEKECRSIGERSLEFAEKNRIPAVVILGHPYVVNSPLFLAGIPECIYENQAIALPADCYPLKEKNDYLERIYWGYGKRLLQIAYEVRRRKNVYPLWLSVYSCGPDSFLIHFFQWICEGKPYTILESDAYSGNAGFKTRVEAFLYGIKNYKAPETEKINDFSNFRSDYPLSEIKSKKSKVVIPWMGEGSLALASLLRGEGINAKALPLETKKELEVGRRVTSGKECLPMILTIGNFLNHLDSFEKEDENSEIYYFMPRAGGPCRFGMYHLLSQIILEKLGLSERVKVVSPSSETGYQKEVQARFSLLAKFWASALYVDFLKDAFLQIRALEKRKGFAKILFDFYLQELLKLLEKGKTDFLGIRDLWGILPLAKRAVSCFRCLDLDEEKKNKPVVLVTGEIFVRLNDFANCEIIKELEEFGLRVKLSPFREWINYVTYCKAKGIDGDSESRLKFKVLRILQRKIEKTLYDVFARELNWKEDHSVDEILKTAEPYLRGLRPSGEAGLTIGLPLLLWKKKEIAGVVAVGPFECMPSRVAESQLNLISQKTGMPVLNLSFYGESLDRDALESFVWDVLFKEKK